MPRKDGTGPAGMGPASGRGAGYCAGAGMFEYAGFGGRCGHGFRAAMGAGRGNLTPWFRFAPENERSLLQNRAEALKSQLNAVEQRLTELNRVN
ncbi:MAG: DUF5320 domain-containing protein [Victivallaceae bacterium]